MTAAPIDLRRFARLGSVAVAELGAGRTARLAFDHVATAWASAAVPRDRVRPGDQLHVELGPPSARLAATLEVVGLAPGAVLDTVELALRSGVLGVEGDARAAERALETVVLHRRAGLTPTRLAGRIVAWGTGTLRVQAAGRFQEGDELVLLVERPRGTVRLRVRIDARAPATFGRAVYDCRPLGVTPGTLERLLNPADDVRA